jgi:anti-anti-sigma factor
VDTKYFDTDNYAQLQRDLVKFVERQQPRKLLVDLGRIEYCSTALISGLLMAQRRVTAAAGTMKLFGLREVVLETLQHLKLVDTMLSVYADETGARDAV